MQLRLLVFFCFLLFEFTIQLRRVFKVVVNMIATLAPAVFQSVHEHTLKEILPLLEFQMTLLHDSIREIILQENMELK